MPFAIGRFTPTDYDVWHDVHLESVRRFSEKLGLVRDIVYRDHDDPQTLVVILEIESVDKYQAFVASPTHAELVSRAKVDGEPTFWYLDKVEEVDLNG